MSEAISTPAFGFAMRNSRIAEVVFDYCAVRRLRNKFPASVGTANLFYTLSWRMTLNAALVVIRENDGEQLTFDAELRDIIVF